MGNGRSLIAGILFIVGILALIAGVVYMVTPAHSLPSFFPGHIASGANMNAKHTARGLAGIILGAVLFLTGVVMMSTGRRPRYRRW